LEHWPLRCLTLFVRNFKDSQALPNFGAWCSSWKIFTSSEIQTFNPAVTFGFRHFLHHTPVNNCVALFEQVIACVGFLEHPIPAFPENPFSGDHAPETFFHLGHVLVINVVKCPHAIAFAQIWHLPQNRHGHGTES
jgi:hypothetical protein